MASRKQEKVIDTKIRHEYHEKLLLSGLQAMRITAIAFLNSFNIDFSCETD